MINGEWVRFPPLACHTQFTPNIPEYPSALHLVEIMENGKHAVMAQYLSYHVDHSSNSITTMYDCMKGETHQESGKVRNQCY